MISAEFGWSVSGGHGLNGNEYHDVIVGAPRAVSSSSVETGAVYVFYARDDGSGMSHYPPDVLWGIAAGDRFGHSVASIGDTNADDYGDVVIGAPFRTVQLSEEGAVYLYRGGSSGVAVTPVWSVRGGQAGAGAGWSVAGDDLNANGLADIVVDAPFVDYTATDDGLVALFLSTWTGSDYEPVLDGNWTDRALQLTGRLSRSFTLVAKSRPPSLYYPEFKREISHLCFPRAVFSVSFTSRVQKSKSSPSLRRMPSSIDTKRDR
jgi:hypothetical protein